MKKYKIVYAYPKGYHVRKRVMLFFWVSCLVNEKSNKEGIFKTVTEAQDAIDRLMKTGKEVRRTNEKHY